MVICCSDSRVEPSILFSTGPGDLFIVRNIANLVPPYTSKNSVSTGAALEYAVKNLMVKDIVVLGHAHCGGVAALCKRINNEKAEWSYYLNKNCKNIYGAFVEYIAIETIFDLKGIQKLECQVLSFNDKVLSLHQKFGFVQNKIEKKFLYRDKKDIDLIYLINYKKLWAIKREEIKKKLKIN